VSTPSSVVMGIGDQEPIIARIECALTL